jgi:hypothetical protein
MADHRPEAVVLTPRAHGRVWRQLFLLLLLLGSFVSLAASGRLTPRLIVDGAISFWFMPAAEVAAFALVLTRRRRTSAFAVALGDFLGGNAPWLWWLVAMGTLFSVIPPRAIGIWLMRATEASALVPFVWSWTIDVRFFQECAHQPRQAAVRSALGQRAIAWSLGIAYFFGIAIWGLTRSALALWLRG